MKLISSFALEQPYIKQYEELLEESNSETFFYGTPLNHMKERIVVIEDDQVVGAFEPGVIEYQGRYYSRTNRPYTPKEFRGRGYMQNALRLWYFDKKPAMAWIDDDNVSSIRLFQNVGFVKDHFLHHKGKDGFVYFLK